MLLLVLICFSLTRWGLLFGGVALLLSMNLLGWVIKCFNSIVSLLAIKVCHAKGLSIVAVFHPILGVVIGHL